jgi:hypothetical protein
LDRARINPNDAQGRLVNPADAEGLAVLRRLYKVYSGFISAPTARSLSNFFEDFPATEDVYDFTSPALAYTENTLNPNRSFKDLFTITRTPVAKREIDTTVVYPFTLNWIYGGSHSTTTNVYSPRSRYGFAFSPAGTNPDSVPVSLMYYASSTPTREDQNLAMIEVGELVGIHYNSPQQIIRTSNSAVTNIQGIPLNFDMNTTLFAGIPFLRTYVLANTNLIAGNSPRPNLDAMPRRLSRSIMHDFLCRELPVIRASDAASFVSTAENANAFRKGSSCVRCHATIDPMAGVYRGVGYISAGDFQSDVLHRYALHVHKSAPVTGFAAESGWPAAKDNDYFKRPATGRLYYRNLSGALVNIAVANGDELSARISEQDDVYVCQARKLFQYFTGVRVDLNDIYDPDEAAALAAMSEKDWEYRNLVIQLGKNLKKHQKVRQTIEEILKLEIYRRTDFGAGQL